MMSHEPGEILSAFLDREPVDPGALARALESADALELLRDFALLRAEVQADDLAPGPELHAAMEPHLARAGRRRLWPAAAAAALLLVLAGIWSESDRIGTTVEVLGLDPGDGPPTTSRVITFVPGVDWNER